LNRKYLDYWRQGIRHLGHAEDQQVARTLYGGLGDEEYGHPIGSQVFGQPNLPTGTEDDTSSPGLSHF
jgi:hypothetical protein